MKVLIYLEENKLSPRGGPYGVGYYYKKEIERHNDKDIEFLKSNYENITKKRKIKQLIPKTIVNLIKSLRQVWTIKNLFNDKENKSFNVDFNNYEIIHFHTTLHLFEARSQLKNYKGIVLLSSHSPVPLAQEICESYGKIVHFFIPDVLEKYQMIDKYAFDRADYFVFPCADAEEPYINAWPEYYNLKLKKHDRYRYVPSGISAVKNKRTRKEIFDELGLDENTFLISYVGRHNEVKGYDLLKKIGERIIHLIDNSHFVICGDEKPLKGLESLQWSEIGWTTDQYSYISASDVFVLPNRETYFDLVMLEVLSLGKIVVASRTGGNKYFEKMNVNGVDRKSVV